MNDQSEKLKSFPEIDFHPTLHAKIMRRLIFLKFRTPFLIIASLLACDLFVSGWHLWIKLVERDTISILQSISQGIELNQDYLISFIQTAIKAVPVGSLIIFVINLLLISYFAYLSFGLKKLPTKQNA